MIEIELKFKVESLRSAKARLKRAEAKHLTRRGKITDLIFDSNNALKKKDYLLRLRDYAGDAFVTFKSKRGTRRKSGFKEREEIEFRVSDARAVKRVFESLGFKAKPGIEKFRESWTLCGCRVELDELPFGTFLEIEGSKPKIRKAAAKLGLDLKGGLTASYFKLARCSR